MDVATKYRIVEKIINTEDEGLLKEIDALLNLSDADFWDDLSASTKASIQRGLEDAQQGRTRPHQEVMNEIKTRFSK
ncbi:hypothetical protein [Tunicatimonas pelagia]|uniref:hypothetical protein n=1 Tax=Tunicatimonas pelagia TaxID=931531 RepID=UPI0026668A4F|nr:hypothetical protein [Tunicatimonas pelagia]WKN40739.1 hypothetical protein P0M28_17010 [Tunicatimonas pelagia]